MTTEQSIQRWISHDEYYVIHHAGIPEGQPGAFDYWTGTAYKIISEGVPNIDTVHRTIATRGMDDLWELERYLQNALIDARPPLPLSATCRLLLIIEWIETSILHHHPHWFCQWIGRAVYDRSCGYSWVVSDTRPE